MPPRLALRSPPPHPPLAAMVRGAEGTHRNSGAAGRLGGFTAFNLCSTREFVAAVRGAAQESCSSHSGLWVRAAGGLPRSLPQP